MPRRRAPGEGSIYQRKDGRWVARIPLPQPDGTTRHKYLYADTQRAARQAGEQYKRDLAARKLPSDAKILLRDYLNEWLANSKEMTLRESSVHVYRWAVGVITEHLGGTRLADLKRPAIQRMVSALARDLEPRSVEIVTTVLTAALKRAVMDEVIPANPATSLDKPRVTDADHTTLTPDEVRTLLTYARAKSPTDAALYAVLITSGVRISEALGLTWEDIDFDTGVIYLRRQLVWPRGGGEPVRRELKSERSRRRLPLLPSTAAELRALRDARPGEPPGALVFVRPGGRPDRSTSVRWRLAAALRTCDLPDITTHKLRHTNATLLLESGVDIAVVSKMLGHADIAITARTYAHVTATLEQAAVARLGALLEPVSEPEGVNPGVIK